MISGWSLLPDPNNPWHVGAFSFSAVNGPDELLRLTLTPTSNLEPGSNALEPLAVKAADPNGGDLILTAHTTFGQIVVPGLKGDVTEDGNITLGDVTLAVRGLLLDPAVVNQPSKVWAGDVNCKDGSDSSDVNRLFRRAFLNEVWPNCDGSRFQRLSFPHGLALPNDES